MNVEFINSRYMYVETADAKVHMLLQTSTHCNLRHLHLSL